MMMEIYVVSTRLRMDRYLCFACVEAVIAGEIDKYAIHVRTKAVVVCCMYRLDASLLWMRLLCVSIVGRFGVEKLPMCSLASWFLGRRPTYSRAEDGPPSYAIPPWECT